MISQVTYKTMFHIQHFLEKSDYIDSSMTSVPALQFIRSFFCLLTFLCDEIWFPPSTFVVTAIGVFEKLLFAMPPVIALEIFLAHNSVITWTNQNLEIFAIPTS